MLQVTSSRPRRLDELQRQLDKELNKMDKLKKRNSK